MSRLEEGLRGSTPTITSMRGLLERILIILLSPEHENTGLESVRIKNNQSSASQSLVDKPDHGQKRESPR
jgi:hypothetical protein